MSLFLDGITGIFYLLNHSDRTVDLRSTQPLAALSPIALS